MHRFSTAAEQSMFCAPSASSVHLHSSSVSGILPTAGLHNGAPLNIPPLFATDLTPPSTEGLAHRSTTYEAKHVPTAPLLKGSLYVQDPNDLISALKTSSKDANSSSTSTAQSAAANLNFNTMTLPQLYSCGYQTYLEHHARQAELTQVLPPAPQDMDNDALTNTEAVGRHVAGLAAAYSSHPEDPLPYELYHHLIDRIMDLHQAKGLSLISPVDDANMNNYMNHRRRASSVAAGGAGSATEEGGGGSSTPNLRRQSTAQHNTNTSGSIASSFSPNESFPNTNLSGGVLSNRNPNSSSSSGSQQQSNTSLSDALAPANTAFGQEALSLALLLATPANLNKSSLALAVGMIQRHPAIADAMSTETIEVLVKLVSSPSSSSSSSSPPSSSAATLDQRLMLLSVLCRLVLLRRHLTEVLWLLQALESMPRTMPSSILPVVVPMIPTQMIQQFTFGPFTMYPSSSPIDALHQVSQRMSTVLPEGTVATRFCISRCGKMIALATNEGVLMTCDTRTWEVLSRARSPVSGSGSGSSASSNGGCWSLQFVHDDTELLVSDTTGRHHHLLLTKGLVPVQRYDSEEPCFARVTGEGQLVFLPPPALPSGHPACLHLAGADRIAFPLLHNNSHSNQSSNSGVGVDGVTPPVVPPGTLVDEFHIAAFIGTDFSGVVLTLDAVGDESFALMVRCGTITLTQGAGNAHCQAILPPVVNAAQGDWLFVVASWRAGSWSLLINTQLAVLHGARTGQSKTVRLTTASGFNGTGRMGSLSVWAGPSSRHTIRTLASSRSLTGVSVPLLHLPLDEGSGNWIKDLATRTVVTLNPLTAMWDPKGLPLSATTHLANHNTDTLSSNAAGHQNLNYRVPSSIAGAGSNLTYSGGMSISFTVDVQSQRSNNLRESTATSMRSMAVPHTAGTGLSTSYETTATEAPTPPVVRLPQSIMLQSNVLQSKYSVTFVLPSTHRGTDDLVIRLSHDSRSIETIQYDDCGSQDTPLLFVNHDETVLYAYAPRFSTFRTTQLVSAKNRADTLGTWEQHPSMKAQSLFTRNNAGDTPPSTSASTSALAATTPPPPAASDALPEQIRSPASEVNTVVVSSIHSAANSDELTDHPGTPHSIATALHRVLYIEGPQLLRIPSALSPFSARNMLLIASALKNGSRPITLAGKTKLLSLLTLGIVHFVFLSKEQDPVVSHVASMLNTACKQILTDYRDDALILEAATELFRVGVSKSLTPSHKADVLLKADDPKHAELIENYTARDSIGSIVDHVSREEPEKLLAVLDGLLRRSELERLDQYPLAATPNLIWFCTFAVIQLVALGHSTVLQSMVMKLLDYAGPKIEELGWSEALQLTAVHTALIPTLIATSRLAPQVIDPTVERRLRSLLGKAPMLQKAVLGSTSEPGRSQNDSTTSMDDALWNVPVPPEDSEGSPKHRAFRRSPTPRQAAAGGLSMRNPTVPTLMQVPTGGWSASVLSFSTRKACDIIPSTIGGPWRLLFDFSSATTVTISKEGNGADVTILRLSGGRQATSQQPLAFASMMEASSASFAAPAPPGTTGNVSTPTSATTPMAPAAPESVSATKRILTNNCPSLKLSGDIFLIYGTGECSLTTVCQYDLHVQSDYTLFLRSAIQQSLITVARYLLARPPPSDMFIAPLLRAGLNRQALEKHQIPAAFLDAAESPSSQLAHDVLAYVNEGKTVVDEALRNMRSFATVAMRPAIQALLAILIHHGCTPTQAEDELKLRWFSGEWGTKLQGEDKQESRRMLTELAEWIVGNVQGATQGVLIPTRRSSSERRASERERLGHSFSMGGGLGERRGSNSSRRSTTKTHIVQSDALDHVRALFSKGVLPSTLEQTLLTRTRAAMAAVRGLGILVAMLVPNPEDDVVALPSDIPSPESNHGAASAAAAGAPGTSVSASAEHSSLLQAHANNDTQSFSTQLSASHPSFAIFPRDDLTEQQYNKVLDAMLEFVGSAGNALHSSTVMQHFIDPLLGSGWDLEYAVRIAFHKVLRLCSIGILDKCPKTVAHHRLLTSSVPKGRSMMSVMSLLCHPFDAVDTEFLIEKNELTSVKGAPMLATLDELSSIPMNNLNLASPWRIRRGENLNMSTTHEKFLRAELLAAADHGSLSRTFPNSFSIWIPATQVTRAENGFAVERAQAGHLTLRADEGWPIMWREGTPRVFYFETTLQTPVYRISIGLTQMNLNSGTNNKHQLVPVPQEGNFMYDNTGLAGTGEVSGPPYCEGDTIGCGVVTSSRRVFFTVNGHFLGFQGSLADSCETIFPTLTLENREHCRIVVNFGLAPFHFDYRLKHPSLCLSAGPSWYRIAETAATVLHAVTARVCAVQDARRPDTRLLLIQCCNMISEGVSRLVGGLMHMDARGSEESSARIRHALVIAMAEALIMKLISSLRHVARLVQFSGSTALGDEVRLKVFESVRVLMLLPLHSVKIATVGLLPEVLSTFQSVQDEGDSSFLVKTIFDLAKIRGDEERIPFLPSWTQCDPRLVSIAHAQVAHMLPEAQRSIVLGSVLPRTGTVSFTIRITRDNMTKGHSLKGGYFVGVAIANLAPLSPPSNSQSWKVLKPPVVWALHDTSPQLPHAVNPTVRPNNFQRTFGSGDVIGVVVNRDAQTISFFRDDVFLKELYQDVPQNLELVPFAQLYNDDASVTIGPGEMTPAITAPTLLAAASVDVLRSMFALRCFENHVAQHLCNELQTDPSPSVSLAVFASLPDPRRLTLRYGMEETHVLVQRIVDQRCKFTTGSITHFDHVQNLRTPSLPTIRGNLDVSFFGTSVVGISRCIEELVLTFSRMVAPLVTTTALKVMESDSRQKLYSEEHHAWDGLFLAQRLSNYENILLSSQYLRNILRSPPVSNGYAFSQPLSHVGFVLSPRYCGRLVTVPSGAQNVTTPFIAIAEPAVPLTGKFSVRCQLIRGHHGQILGGGYYFGVCASSFTCKRREMNVSPPDVWAIHDMDDAPWRLRHLTIDRRLPTAADPNCLIVSGDIIRLEIDRDEGTMHAFRKPGNSNEEIFIGFLFDNLPKGVELYPFVHMYNTDAVAVLLPSSATVPPIRTTVQMPHMAITLANHTASDRRCCDGCVSQHRETKLTGQDWYKCNDCVDYCLCAFCFCNFVHSHHSFTKMDSRSLIHTDSAPTKVHPGMSLIVPGCSSQYLKSVGCTMPEPKMSCVALAHEEDALVVWGLVPHGDEVVFTAFLEGTNLVNSQFSSNRPLFIGIGDAQEVLTSSVEDLRTRCVTGAASMLSICSDSRVRRKFLNPSLSPFGFHSGSTVTIQVSFAAHRARVSRDWIDVGSLALPTNFHHSSKLVGFILFGSPNISATILPERTPDMLVTVAEVLSPSLMRVTDGHEISRYCSVQDARVPIIPVGQEPIVVGNKYYIFQGKTLHSCVVAVNDKELLVHLPEDPTSLLRVAPTQLFRATSPMEPVTPTLRVMDVSTTTQSLGPALMPHGFVMSRLLIILSCIMEDPTLAPILLQHSGRFLTLINLLASVTLSNEVPAEFMTEVRHAVAVTAQVSRNVQLHHQRLGAFVPTNFDPWEERSKGGTFHVREGMLVSIIEGSLRGSLFRALSDGTESFRAEPLVPSGGGDPYNNNIAPSVATINSAVCVVAKQCAGEPWWSVPGGLPCSLVEHTLRSEAPPRSAAARVHVSLEGEWHGELITAQNANMSMTLSLVMTPEGEASGVARVVLADGHVIDARVRGEHNRYARSVRLVCSYSSIGPHMHLNDLRMALRSFNVTAPADATKEEIIQRLTPLCQHLPQPLWTLRGTIDAVGLRISGTWKHTEGLTGTFSMSSLRVVSLASGTRTPLRHVEPLPDFVDRVPPAPAVRQIPVTLHRLIVMLARHLYLIFVSRSTANAKREVRKHIILYHAHPLAERFICGLMDTQPQRFYRVLSEALSLVLDPNVKPWDSATLSSIVTRCVMMKPNTLQTMPSLYWDCLHAVVAAAHHCGEDYRHVVLRNVITLIQSEQKESAEPAYAELLTTLCAWVDRSTSAMVGITTVRRDVATGVELLLNVNKAIADAITTSVPLAPLRCMIDMAHSLTHGLPLPYAVEQNTSPRDSANATTIEVQCPFGQYADRELKVGKVMSNLRTTPTGRFYYEVILPEKNLAPFAVGWGTAQHTDIPSQHVGSDAFSFAFGGNHVVMKQGKEEYRVGVDITPGVVVGCMIDMTEKVAAWSVNGSSGPLVPIPIAVGDGDLIAFASTGTCSGMKICMEASSFQFVPDGYRDLAGRTNGICVTSYDEFSRSKLPVRSLAFYAQAAAYLSDLQAASSSGSHQGAAAAATSASSPVAGGMTSPSHATQQQQQIVGGFQSGTAASMEVAASPADMAQRYPLLADLSPEDLERSTIVVKMAESCMQTSRRFVDLDSQVVDGTLSTSFLCIKQIVTRSFRRKLVDIPLLERNTSPSPVTIRYSELLSTIPRTSELALHHSLLGQLYRQIGSFSPKQMQQIPLFKVHLYISGSNHAPQDMGGPYRQLWTLIGDEIMTHPDNCYPHTDFHRNPLFRFTSNSQRVALVPDASASSPAELAYFTFFGKLLGHMARARTPIALDLSPLVWKFLVEDPITIRDYYQHVDSVVEKSLEDPAFLASEVAEDVIPGYAEALQNAIDLVNLTKYRERQQRFELAQQQQQSSANDNNNNVVASSATTAAAGGGGSNANLSINDDEDDDDDDDPLNDEMRRSIAEDCLVRSMDVQLTALREGLWSLMPKRVTRCLCWLDLERAVCGDSNPTLEQMRDAIQLQLQSLREQFFWRLVEEMNGAQRSALLCFACGQRRLPLLKKILVTENMESPDHLPRAQSCSAMVTIPCYNSYDVFRAKMLAGIEHQTEMELA